MAKRVVPVPDDLAFQTDIALPATWNGWTCRELVCERYPDLRIRIHEKNRSHELVQYFVENESFKSLKRAYNYLKSKPRRVRRENKPTRNANGDRQDSRGEVDVSPKGSRRSNRKTRASSLHRIRGRSSR